MIDDRFSCQMAFLSELDRMKLILRQTLVADGSRSENDAEHSWHVAMMAVILAEHAITGADPLRAALMLMFHDVVEIDAGDTFIHDVAGNANKAEREQKAADRLYGLLPSDQRDSFRALWEEFEARQTATARYAQALDRLQPIINNVQTQGRMWHKNNIHPDKMTRLVDMIQDGSPTLAEYARSLIATAKQNGFFPSP